MPKAWFPQREKTTRLPRRGRAGHGWRDLLSPEAASPKPSPGLRAPTREELARAMDSVPERIEWEWAQPRLVPVLERLRADSIPGDPYLGSVADSGVRYGFAAEVGPLLLRVGTRIAELWECTVEQIRDQAMANLAARVRRLTTGSVQRFRENGVQIHALGAPSGIGSSVVLLPDELSRLLGPEDFLVVTPIRAGLIAFSLDEPAAAVMELIEVFDHLGPEPLQLEPFRLVDGRLTWEGAGSSAGET